MHALELPTEYLLWRFRIPDHLIERIGSLPPNWRAEENQDAVKDIGTQWLAGKRRVALAVPSVVVPLEQNFVLNPDHPGFGEIVLDALGLFEFDRRLRPTHADLTHEG